MRVYFITCSMPASASCFEQLERLAISVMRPVKQAMCTRNSEMLTTTPWTRKRLSALWAPWRWSSWGERAGEEGRRVNDVEDNSRPS